MDPKQIEAFFLRAMVDGYASGTKSEPVPGMPGHKGIRFEDEETGLVLVDAWCVNDETDKSFGSTTITLEQAPLWVMLYGGYYHERAIPLVRAALRKAYEEGLFFGGRGPASLLSSDGSLTYVNRPSSYRFPSFMGSDEVTDTHTGKILGFHRYWGMSLIRAD